MPQQDDQPRRLQPNHFELKHQHTHITYDVTAFDGKPHLTYQVLQGPAARTFIGDQIHIQQTDIGTLVTVTLEAIPDDKSTLLTLIIPGINLIRTTEQSFETVGILTTVRDSIGGPSLVNGAVESYHTMKFTGKAQFVEA